MRKKLALRILMVTFMFMVVIAPNLLALDETSSLDCSGGTVMAGDAEDSVREKCGDPQEVTQRDKYSPVVWFYNFGPSEFVYYVTFTNGMVERLQTGDYGN
ncbi:hypothetical protein D1AOALGA4SA_10313 [Olavius algarvensis Delta 1 endosymbiont]|nr:hypothetical protein D1AOALGA4SA_10313 [Olavius algarvensis Delta 1 endosymbiont]